jgi:DNA-binding transcriptional LysR family regulator
MPLPMIEADLMAGTLMRLTMPDHPGGTYRFAAIWRRDTPPGPAAAWLLEQLTQAAGPPGDEVLPDI